MNHTTPEVTGPQTFHLIVVAARTWATEMGYTGDAHRTAVKHYVDVQLEDYK
jgi:hypothetical protein